MRLPLRRLAALLVLSAAACERQPATSIAQDGPPPAPPPTRAVVTERLAACDESRPELPAPPEDVDERVDGLLATLASTQARMREVALEELDELGDGVVPALEQRLANRELDTTLRIAVAECLGRLGAGGSHAAAEALLASLETSRTALEREPWLYAQCAWQLGVVRQPWVVPRLVLCLKYEKDHPTVAWLADSLGRYGLLSGLEALFVIQREGDEEARALAEGVLMRLQREVGASDWNDLARRWDEGQEPPSQRLEDDTYLCELWRTISALAEWQLRGVDDARYILSHLGSGEAQELGEALADDDVYVRLHTAQCLERMGPKAAGAGPALIARLDDPQVGPQAAAALGAVGYAPAAEALRERTQARWPLELRVAAAVALVQLAPADLDTTLRPLIAATEPVDLRCAAATGLVSTGPPDAPAASLSEPVRLLAGWLVSGEVEPRLAEDALGNWLGRRAEAGDSGARAVLDAWLAVPIEPEEERLAQRSALVLERASELGL